MKKLALTLLLGILSINFSYCQDYYIVDKDTTYCKELKFWKTSQGYLKGMKYKNLDGTVVSYNSRKESPNVITFHINDVSIDKIPLNPNKPNKKYVRFLKRSVDGKIKTYSNDSSRPLSRIKFTSDGWKHGGIKTGAYHYTIKMPDGKFYDIKKGKNIKKIVKPFLLQCNEFKKQYNGDYKTSEKLFNEMIELYNSLCQ